MCGIVREGDEVSAALVSGDRRGAPDIGVYLITEALGWRTNAELWHRQASCARKDAGVTISSWEFGSSSTR